MPLALAVAALVVTTAATVQQVSSANSAKKDAARAAGEAMATNDAIAQFNTNVDRADEHQLDLNSTANIRAMRKDASVYMSRQESAYAASGVRTDTGSPVAVKAATAGAFALREQQAHTDTNARMERIESSAQAGLAESAAQSEAIRVQGQAQSDAYGREATAAVLSGAGKMLSIASSMYGNGAFGGAGGGGGGGGGFSAPPQSSYTPYTTGGFDTPTFSGGYT